MLVLESTAVKKSSFWGSGAAYAILRDEIAVGRIDLLGRRQGETAAEISLRDTSFSGRIHRTGKAKWSYVPSRWMICAGETPLHGATWESARLFLTETEPRQEPLRLHRNGSDGSFALERASDQTRIGAIRRQRRKLFPTLVPLRFRLETSLDLEDTFALLLLWIVVQDDLYCTD